jgi:hypothetical protein
VTLAAVAAASAAFALNSLNRRIAPELYARARRCIAAPRGEHPMHSLSLQIQAGWKGAYFGRSRCEVEVETRDRIAIVISGAGLVRGNYLDHAQPTC